MGGICSKRSTVDHAPSRSSRQPNGHEAHGSGKPSTKVVTQPPMGETMEKRGQESHLQGSFSFSTNQNNIEDGIPRFPRDMSHKSRSTKHRPAGGAKASEGSSLLGRASTVGLGKAVDVLDTLGSSMTNLNRGSGFVSGAATKGNKISILAFEVANTIVKGCKLMQSLSNENIRNLKEVVLPSEGVQFLVSKDIDELVRIAAADKREELKVFSGEVIRFGNRCKDPQWHNLERYFEKVGSELLPQKQLKEEAQSVMQQLMTIVQFTAELYHESHALDRFEQDYRRKLQEDDSACIAQKGDSLTILKAELKSQKKNVKSLKKKSLWSKILEEVMEKLVDIVHFLHLEIHDAFGATVGDKPVKTSMSNRQLLGPAGLALHYANIITQIDTIVSRSAVVPSNTRDTLYQGLPPSIKSALRSKLQSSQLNNELTVPQIREEMEKTLRWLAPIATNTNKAHHGFGWVGEWANTGSDANRKPTSQPDLIRIETLHHADKEKTEIYILDLVVWLHHLVSLSRAGTGVKSPIKSPSTKSPIRSPNTQEKLSSPPKDNPQTNTRSFLLTDEDQQMLRHASKRKMRISKSQDFDSVETKASKQSILSKSYSYSTSTSKNELFLPVRKPTPSLPVIDFCRDKIKALDVIDRVDSI